MTAIMEMDTALWLHNKLGSDDNLWSTGSIASQFTKQVLNNIYDCFLQLDDKMKIKTLLSFLEIPLRNVQDFQEHIDDIVNIAESDPDEWVKVAANIVKDYPKPPSTLALSTSSFQETLDEIISEIETNDTSSLKFMLPMECTYLNRTALLQTVPEQGPPTKHFTLRRKPKSAELRAKITQKATDAVNQRRSSHPTNSQTPGGKANFKRANSLNVPVPHTKLGKSSASQTKKTKLLDIADQPLGVREMKKRKKMLALEAQMEEARQRKLAKENKQKQAALPVVDSESADEEKPIDVEDTTVSDNEAEELEEEEKSGLDSTIEDIKPATSGEISLETPGKIQTPSYANIPGTSQDASENTPKSSDDTAFPFPQNQLTSDINSPTLPQQPQTPGDISGLVNVDPNASYATQNLQRELQMRVQQEHDLLMQREQQQQQQQQQQQRFNQQVFQQQQINQQPYIGIGAPPIGIPHQLPQIHPHQAMNLPPPTQPMMNQQKKGLSLNREQMLAAQEMFRSANRVTRAEKALILGFMAGARENPFPNQGPIITIKLSEETETVHQGNTPQTMFIEMLFEMNYETGHWRRLKRTRVMSQQGSSS